jgi:hypothetical protein
MWFESTAFHNVVNSKSRGIVSVALGRIHIKPAAALTLSEIRRGLGAALRPPYRGGRWFESTTAPPFTGVLEPPDVAYAKRARQSGLRM